MRFLIVGVITVCAVSVSFVGQAAADSSTPADQLRPFGASVDRPPWFPVYAFSVSCSALPCSVRLTERAFAQGRHIAGLDRLHDPAIVMNRQPPPGQVFAVWFQRTDFDQHLLSAAVARYGSVQIHMTALSTDAEGNKVAANRTVSIAPTVSVVGCADPNADNTSGKGKPSTCIFHQANTGYFGYTQSLIEGMNWTGWGSPVASTSGTFQGNMDARFSATVRLSGLRACPGLFEKVYTQVSITLYGTFIGNTSSTGR
jgi:hypothetical protein